jgi:uroporphyrin-III C-methyltransferase
MMGKVYLVGAGPGDLELLTLKALKLIKSADVIIYDRLINPEILTFAKLECEFVYVGKKEGYHTLEQEKINELLLEYAYKKDVVVRLKGGDPFVFGRGGEEMLFLIEHGIEVEVVPGVSSAIGVSTSVGVPLTFRGVSSSFAVITGHEDPNKKKSSINWDCLKGIDTLVFLMGVSRRREIAQKLLEIGRNPDEPIAFIERGTASEEKVLFSTLKELSENPIDAKPPALMLVGNVLKIAKKIKELNNYEQILYGG